MKVWFNVPSIRISIERVPRGYGTGSCYEVRASCLLCIDGVEQQVVAAERVSPEVWDNPDARQFSIERVIRHVSSLVLKHVPKI